MAEVTGYIGVDPALSDIRREAVEHSAEIRRDTAFESGRTREVVATKTDEINNDIKATGWLINDRVQDEADRVTGKMTDFFISQQSANAANALASAKLEALLAGGFSNLAQLNEKNTQIGALQTQKYVSEDGEKTRALINDLKNADLNRMLIERNSDVNYYRAEADRWEGVWGNGQFAALASQINALNSNLSETRQGLYNFGTMAGVGQSSTSNQVR